MEQSSRLSELISARQLVTSETKDRRIRDYLHAHKTFVEHLGFHSQLEGHRGCVNCLQWSADGCLLASGSDDLDVHIWSPLEGKSVACMHTGHTGNIFSVKFMPFTGDSVLCTGAEDREVRMHDLTTFQTTHCWACCAGRVKRLAVSPHLPFMCWCASEDGCVRMFDTRERHTCVADGRCRNVLIDLRETCGTAMGYTQCKCVDVNPVRSEQIAVGALDAYVRLYDTRVLTLKPPSTDLSTSPDPSCLAHFAPGHISNQHARKGHHAISNTLATTYLTFSPCGTELLVNLSGEQVYLYSLQHDSHGPVRYEVVGEEHPPRLSHPPPPPPLPSYHPVLGWRTDQVHAEEAPSPHLMENNVSDVVLCLRDSGNELYEGGQHSQAIQKYSSAIQLCPKWHVLYSNRATVYMKRNWFGDQYEALRDTEHALRLCPSHQKSLRRRIKCLKSLGLLQEASGYFTDYCKKFPDDNQFISHCQSELAELVTEGSRNGYSVERRQLSQWEASRQQTACDYRSRFCGHCNTHTDIKEASFLGERGEYVAAGSDDGNVFIWEKVTGNLVRVLRGDDSIVNCVQWHPQMAMLATSGIESVVRLWQPCQEGLEEGRVVEDAFKVSKANQQRMKMDPFEIMLMRMGLRMAMMGDELQAAVPEGGPQEGGAFFIEQSGRCRQS